ncbi:MAG: M48 family metallopeptidase [Woeseia sp.]|nr:M48 family metallopeptidase [Woeseia sp.]
MQRATLQLQLFPDDGQPAAETAGTLPAFSVRESGRAKRLSIKVFPRGRIEVVVPKRTRPADVASFVAENREWMRAAREELTAGVPPEPFELPDKVYLEAIDRRFRILYEERAGASKVNWRQSGDTVKLAGPVADEQQCVAALKRWLASVAKTEFAPRLEALSALTQVPFSRMQVRAQRTCWGSRSCSGTISLNVCLLFLRPTLLRYLLIHELCHGKHMNHSRRFWAMVERFQPDSKCLDRELGESWRTVPVWVGLV